MRKNAPNTTPQKLIFDVWGVVLEALLCPVTPSMHAGLYIFSSAYFYTAFIHACVANSLNK